MVESEGRMFPVETRYSAETLSGNPILDTTAAVLKALREDTGSILVFLPGAGEIRSVYRRLGEAGLEPSITVVPLYGALGRDVQMKAIEPAPPGMRKVVLATAIAETSLTIEGVRIVIDAGLMRVPRFDLRSAMTRLMTIPVSRDSADQRRGRAGRQAPGICYRLWSRERHAALLERSSPDILAVDLAPLALELAAWGVSGPDALSWIDPPPAGGLCPGPGASPATGRHRCPGPHHRSWEGDGGPRDSSQAVAYDAFRPAVRHGRSCLRGGGYFGGTGFFKRRCRRMGLGP